MNLLQFQEVVESRLGLYFDDSKETDLLRRIKSAMAEAKITDSYLYYTRLYNEPADSPLWLNLSCHLTVGETYFFRDSAQMHALRTAILPEIIEQKRSGGTHSTKCLLITRYSLLIPVCYSSLLPGETSL